MKTTYWGRSAAVFAIASSLLLGSAGPGTAAPAVPAAVEQQVVVVAEASGDVAVKKIPNKIAKLGGKAKVKPVIETTGNVELSSAKLTVKHGSKTVAKNKSSVWLPSGTYTVTTTATYKTFEEADGETVYSPLKKAAKTQKLTVRNAVWIKRIAGKTAPYGGKATIKPKATKSPGAKITSKTVTVKQGGYTVAKNKAKASLKAGKYSVTTTLKYKFQQPGTDTWSKTYTSTKKQSLTIKAGKKPSRVSGTGSFNCPAGYPIKGNRNSRGEWIYHMPWNQSYNATNPEDCFATQSAARNAGYRAAKI